VYNFGPEYADREAPPGSAMPIGFPEQAREQAVLVPALPGAAPFAACLQLFRLYPLAVTRHSADGGSRSMVLVNRAAGPAGFSVLTQVRGDLFAIRAWNGHSRVSEEIRAEQSVSRLAHQAVTGSMPVPRDGVLLGWVTDSQVTALLSVHFKQPGTWDGPLPIPEIQVMPMSGNSDLLDWPPFTASPLGDERLWEYVERGSIVDMAPLVTQCPGHAFWVPFPADAEPGATKAASSSRTTCRVMSTGCPPASTLTTGFCARASSRRRPTACWRSPGPWTWPAASGSQASETSGGQGTCEFSSGAAFGHPTVPGFGQQVDDVVRVVALREQALACLPGGGRVVAPEFLNDARHRGQELVGVGAL
jgi:hypothetical protein